MITFFFGMRTIILAQIPLRMLSIYLTNMWIGRNKFGLKGTQSIVLFIIGLQIQVG